MPNYVIVGLGEIKLSQNPEDVLVAYGLGSCLGIGMYDPIARSAGLLHAVLPYHPDGHKEFTSRYVDSGIQAIVYEMEKLGADRTRLIIRMAGGANMLTIPGFTQSFNIGTRNVEAARAIIKTFDLRLASYEVGGTIGRTIRFYVNDGRMTIRTVSNQEREI
jgi:chemotaxis protein CheD